jgi:hypothetical protein
MRIKSLSGGKPHPSRGSWRHYLDHSCELRDEARGVKHYGAVNCNYILFPCGTLIENFGYWGRVVMNKVRKQGRVKTLKDIVSGHQAYQAALKKCLRSLDGLTAALGSARNLLKEPR